MELLTARLHLGKWFGIDHYLNWLWFFVVGIMFFLGWQYGVLYVTMFGIVLLHEYGHCYAAHRLGYEADEITLSPLGGLARMVMPTKAAHELIVVAGGPLVNVALIPPLVGLCFVHPLFVLLCVANVFMLLFNLLPAFPMDGGRALRATLQYLWRDRRRATLVAGRIGQVFAGLFVLLALYLGSIILAAVGAFVFFQAETEIKHEQRREAAEDPADESLRIIRDASRNST